MINQTKHNKGFTLIELMLAVALLSVIATVGITNMRNLYVKSELQQAASDFAGTLRYAQQRAVMERMPIRVVVDVEKNTFRIPVPEEEERRHYQSRSHRQRSDRRSGRANRVDEVEEISSRLPEGFIFEFVYHHANDDEIKRGEGEFHFYPDGSADAAYFTLLRLADSREEERRVFLKVSPATGMVKSMQGHTNKDGEEFYRGYYDDTNYAS